MNKLVFSLSLTLYLLSLVSLLLTLSQTASLSGSPSFSHSLSQTASLSRSLSISGRSIVIVTSKFQNPNPIIAGTDLGFRIFILGLFNWTCLLGRRTNCLGRQWPRGCRKVGSIPNPDEAIRLYMLDLAWLKEPSSSTNGIASK